MKNNIILCKKMVYAEGLTFNEGSELLARAKATPANEWIVFCLEADGGESLWRLTGLPRAICRAFAANPDDFVISRTID